MSQTMAIAEKRKHTRMEKQILLKVATMDSRLAPQWTVVTSKNISAGGVLFGYNRRLDSGTPLFLKIHVSGRTIDCNGTVRRAEPGLFVPLATLAVSLRGLEKSERMLIETHAAA